MREFKKRRTVGSEVLRISIGMAGVILLGLVAFAASRAAWDMYGKFASASEARSTAEGELATLQDRYVKIHTDVQALSSERGLEAAVRERYGVARPGEGQIDIVRESTSSDAVRQEPGFFERLWRMLFVW